MSAFHDEKYDERVLMVCRNFVASVSCFFLFLLFFSLTLFDVSIECTQSHK